MEGKETRFGIWSSTLFAASTTGTSTGAVNSMHDSYSPLGGGVALLNMMLGEISPGGPAPASTERWSSPCSPCSSPG